MKVLDSLKKLSTIFAGQSTDKIKFSSLTRESVIEMIEDNQNMLAAINSTVFSFSLEQQEDIFKRLILKVKTDKNVRNRVNHQVLEFLTTFPNHLEGKARNMRPIPFGAFQHTSIVMGRMLEMLSKDLDGVFDKSDNIVIGNTKISQGIFFGIVKAADVYSNMICMMFGVISDIITNRSLDTTPRYQYDYIIAHKDAFLNIVNDVCNNTDRHSVINDITKIKNSGSDFKFNVGDGVGAANASHFVTGVIGMENPFLSIFALLIRPIALIGEMYIDMRHDYYVKMKTRKEWLESHVAIINYEMANKDHSDPEYIHLSDIIGHYTDKISAIDKKLSKYYNED